MHKSIPFALALCAVVAPIGGVARPIADGTVLTALNTEEELSLRLSRIFDDEAASDYAKADAGIAAVASHLDVVKRGAPGERVLLLEHTQRKLAAAREMVAVLDQDFPDDLARTVAMARVGTRWQAAAVGAEWSDGPPPPSHASPSEALSELASRYGVDPGPEQARDMQALDDLPEPVRSALTRVLDAFLAMDAAARPWQASAAPAAQPWGGSELVRVLSARLALIDAVRVLRDSLVGPVAMPASHSPTASLADVYSIDLGIGPDTYSASESYAFLLDVGGSDTYLNNAGGSNRAFFGNPGFCGSLIPDPALFYPAAALIDLDGGDFYGSAASPRSCGINGGGFDGVGFLLDAGLQRDEYRAGSRGVNGGTSSLGTGFLLDVGGDDHYEGTHNGVNGGSGFLLDGGGSDMYEATGSIHLNGGGGLLIDVSGGDTYSAPSGTGGVNGGAYGGDGFLFDGDGGDTYTAYYAGTNGGGTNQGRGLLVDIGGDDHFFASHGGTNGGSDSTSVGMLLDFFGVDTYTALGAFDYGAVYTGVNGGVAYPAFPPNNVGVGLLLDVGGTGDQYAEDCDGAGNPTTTAICGPAQPTGPDLDQIPKGTHGMALDI